MKIITLAMLAVLAPVAARADTLNLRLDGFDGQLPPPAESRSHRGEIMRGVGIAVTAAGVALLASSVYLISKSNFNLHFCYEPCPDYPPDNGYLGYGLLTALGALVHLGVGIPLWAVGQHYMNYPLPYVTAVQGGAIAGVTLVGF
jgi:hypothetical protein